MRTKNKTLRKIAWIMVVGLAISCGACKKSSDNSGTTTPVTPAKTLNKSTLTNNKTWYNQGSSIVNEFHTGGVFGTDGEWRWVNNSDTMEIKRMASGSFVKWKFNWNTDTEMECEWIGQGGARAFKSTPW